MSEMIIEVQPRSETGKNVNRRLRASGKVPAVVYGDQLDPVNVQVEERAVSKLLRSASGENSIFQLQLAGTDESRHAMIRELQSDAIRGDLIHIDFLRIRMSEKIQVSVPIELVGEAEGVRTHSGVMDFMLREIEVEVLPANIPDAIEVDVTELDIGDHIEVGQVELPEGVDLLEDADRTIVTVSAQRVEEEEETDDDDELLESTEEQPERVGDEDED